MPNLFLLPDLGSCSDETRARTLLQSASGGRELDFSRPLTEVGYDGRIRTLKPEPRPYPVLRIVTAIDMAKGPGWSYCLSFLAELGEWGIDWQWYVFGEPLDEAFFEELTETFENRGYSDSITFMGPYKLEGLIQLAMNMDLALCPALGIPLHLCTREVAQLGLPLLVLDDEVSRFLPQDTQTFYASRILQDPPAWRLYLKSLAEGQATVRIKRSLRLERSWREIAEQMVKSTVLPD